VRLFANLVAGHIIIFALLGLIALLGAVALPTIALAIFIYCIEVLVCFIQAYIFTLLSAIFISLTHHPHH
jgi:F-type H+-transporting ATPase subunit a